MKVFDWLRLFDTTTFYIKLILVTLVDILPFFLILPFFMLMFGTSLHILSLSREEDNSIVDPFMSNWVLDILVNEYLLALGEFTMDNFAGEPNSALITLLFILASFLTTVTALNMLIAIMADTFGKVLEAHEKHAREMKISILAEYIEHIRKENDERQDTFIVMVKPVESNSAASEWEGAINTMRTSMEKSLDNIHDGFNSKIDMVRDLVTESRQRQTA